MRTRPSVPMDPTLIPVRRRCDKCGCILAIGNQTDTCAPCSLGKVEIPPWAEVLVEHYDLTFGPIAAVARTVKGETSPYRANPEPTTERGIKAARDHRIAAFCRQGYLPYDLARVYGLSTEEVEEIAAVGRG